MDIAFMQVMTESILNFYVRRKVYDLSTMKSKLVPARLPESLIGEYYSVVQKAIDDYSQKHLNIDSISLLTSNHTVFMLFVRGNLNDETQYDIFAAIHYALVRNRKMKEEISFTLHGDVDPVTFVALAADDHRL